MGTVYLARDSALDRQVAIKLLTSITGLPEAEQEEAKARFLREARAAAALTHRNIVTVYDVGDHEGIPYIAMEYLEGTTLDRHALEGHLLPIPKVLEIGMEAALALDVAHRAGIVHRDVKPANLLLLKDGTLKVADFGLAKELESALTSEHFVVGTPNYMSPEQVAGQQLDGRADLFSLAVSIYELLVGSRPFPGDTVSSVLYRVVNEPPVPMNESPSGRGKEVPTSLAALLERALSKDPDERPPDGASFARALRAELEQLGGVVAGLELPPPAAEEELAAARSGAKGPPRAAGEARKRGGDEKKAPAAGASRRSWGTLLALLLLLLLVLVVAGWTAPLYAGFDPLGERRRPVESWLSETLGGFGDLVRITAPEERVLVETRPEGLPFEFEGPPGVRVEEGSVLVLPGDLAEPVTLRVADPCYEGSLTLRPGAYNSRELLVATQSEVQVRVVSEPEGAAVELDGQRQAETTPLSVRLARCQPHELVLTKRGRQDARVELAADASPEAWEQALASVTLPPPEQGRLVIPEAPFGAQVFVRGQGVSRTLSPGESLSLPPGRYRVSVVAESHLVFIDTSTEVPAGGRRRLDVDYPRLGRVELRSVPPGATVYGRGRGERLVRLGETQSEVRLAAGPHELIFEREPGGPRVTRRVEIRAGDANEPVAVGRGDWPGGS